MVAGPAAPDAGPPFAAAADRAGRLDVVLAALDPDHSRSQWGRWIRAGRVAVDGQTVTRPAHAVEPGQRIEATLPAPPPATVEPQPVPFTVLHADSDLIVVDKPAGVVVHPGVLHEQATLVHGLIHEFPDLQQGFTDDDGQRPGIVHRLDQHTSGVMAVARTAAARLDLVAQFQARTVGKTYLAWVFGVPSPPAGEWTGPIARHPKHRKRFAVVEGGKPAATGYRVAGRWGERAARLELDLRTGRTHQIRVHARHAGHPLLGDPVYRHRGKVPAVLQPWAPERGRPALHAWQLELRHPRTGAAMRFEAPLPADLLELDRPFEPGARGQP